MKEKTHPVGAAFRAAFPVTLPVLTGFLVLGLAYGVLMATKGYGPLWAATFQRRGLLRQYAVRGHHAADHRSLTPFRPFLAEPDGQCPAHLLRAVPSGEVQGPGLEAVDSLLSTRSATRPFPSTSTVEPPEGVEPRAPFYLCRHSAGLRLYWVAGSPCWAACGGRPADL